MAGQDPCFSSKHPCFSSKHPCFCSKHPCFSRRHPRSYLERPCFVRKRPCLDAKPPCFGRKHPCIRLKHPCFGGKHPCFARKHPCFTRKHPCFGRKHPCFGPDRPRSALPLSDADASLTVDTWHSRPTFLRGTKAALLAPPTLTTIIQPRPTTSRTPATHTWRGAIGDATSPANALNAEAAQGRWKNQCAGRSHAMAALPRMRHVGLREIV